MAVEKKRGDYENGAMIPGTVYRVIGWLGAGGMGTVYDVEDTTVGKRYVLKTLHPELGSRDDLTRRMIAEARVLAKLTHPNIVEVVTAGATADEAPLPYFVMERLNGQNLRAILEKNGALETSRALHIAIDLLDALDNAHDKGVIHRDVKPDNIFLHRSAGGSTVTKLLDFGIMRTLDNTRGETAGRFLGTLRYAAPEQLRGAELGPKIDLYSAGLVLYEMLAGRGPFDEERDAQRVGRAHLKKAPPPLSKWVSVPPELEAIVMAALAKEVDARPKDAFSFAAELRAIDRALMRVSQRAPESKATAVDVLRFEADTKSEPKIPSGDEAASSRPEIAAATDVSDRTAGASPQARAQDARPAIAKSDSPHPISGTDAGMDAPRASGVAPELALGVDRAAATKSFAANSPNAEPAPDARVESTEPLTPAIAVTDTADPFGATQRALEPVSPRAVYLPEPSGVPAREEGGHLLRVAVAIAVVAMIAVSAVLVWRARTRTADADTANAPANPPSATRDEHAIEAAPVVTIAPTIAPPLDDPRGAPMNPRAGSSRGKRGASAAPSASGGPPPAPPSAKSGHIPSGF